MEAFPNIKTIDSFLPPNSTERYSQSSTLDFHNKATGGERRLAVYLTENIRHEFEPLEHFIYSTQLIQSECLTAAYQLWRRHWKGPRKEYCAGALVWQLNDCWPGISW
jgi:beta-mannosidase